MPRQTSQIRDAVLTRHDTADTLAVGSAAWYAWLDQASSFAFVGVQGNFTARKEQRERGGFYWRAYRTRGGKSYRAYLGRSDELTLARLEAAAAQLSQAAAALPAAPTSGDLLLSSKLALPRLRGRSIERPQLLRLLDAGAGGVLTLISAPAGFGKTTLLADWIGLRRTALPEAPVAWLSLDQGDNDLATLARYLVAALRQLAPRAPLHSPTLLQLPQLPLPGALLTALANDLAAAPPQSVLVLDDYHAITAPGAHEAVQFIVEHAPSTLHLAIAGRSEPPLRLQRLRARGLLTELRASQLRFSSAEAGAFLHDVMGLALAADEVERLTERTEGWAAGLQLAALAIHEQAPLASLLSGGGQHVAAYLGSEVFERLPTHLQTFLLQTSILTRLCGPLCDAVVGLPGAASDDAASSYSQLVLEQIERANLFLVPLDHERRWFRYHQLFAAMIRERLERGAAPQALALLHRRAAAWYERQRLSGEALEHALLGADWERAGRLLAGPGLELMLGGQAQAVLGWIRRVPAAEREAQASLGLLLALGELLCGEVSAPQALERAVQVLAGAAQAALAEAEAPLAALRAELARAAVPEAALARLPTLGAAQRGDAKRQELREPLSAREREVLELLASGHTNTAIAERLVIAVSTVKSHINNIFAKLDVATRLDAVLRAQQLRLLE
jgi:LuxR family transcriptional regulator, maltose regulon positive regulatory protein